MEDALVKVLVVDDDEFTAELTGLSLESAGYEVEIAVGGMEALEKISEDKSIRLVVSDMNMPFIDGAQLYALLRQQGMNLPFVLLTGEDAAAVREANADVDAVLAKNEDFQEELPRLVGALLTM